MHMGARLRPLLTVLFRMIPRFPPTRGMRECATPTTPARSGRRRASPQRSSPTHTTSNPGNHHTRNTHQHSPCLRRHDTPHWTDLDAEVDRSRRGVRPISARVTTDLGGGAVGAGRLGSHKVGQRRRTAVDNPAHGAVSTGVERCVASALGFPHLWAALWKITSMFFHMCAHSCG